MSLSLQNLTDLATNKGMLYEASLYTPLAAGSSFDFSFQTPVDKNVVLFNRDIISTSTAVVYNTFSNAVIDTLGTDDFIVKDINRITDNTSQSIFRLNTTFLSSDTNYTFIELVPGSTESGFLGGSFSRGNYKTVEVSSVYPPNITAKATVQNLNPDQETFVLLKFLFAEVKPRM